MKKIITVSLMVVALNASAGFGNGPWGNNGWNNVNNGIVAHNPYSMMTPDWFSEEMDDMMDEFDTNSTPWNSNGYNNRPWNNNSRPWNSRNQSGSVPWQNNNWNQGFPGNSQPFNFRNNSFRPMNNAPWNNVTPVSNTQAR
ncbi:hypothetical protein OAM82_01735 [Candidatus Thioglobus sp.]|nr:hypothetical protein [Candidatus Thioglobus sp.]